MEKIQFIQVTPEELQDAILNGMEKQLDELKKTFQPKEPVEYLTKNDVRDLFSVDIGTVTNWAKRGILKPVGIGKRVYFRRSDIEKAVIDLKH